MAGYDYTAAQRQVRARKRAKMRQYATKRMIKALARCILAESPEAGWMASGWARAAKLDKEVGEVAQRVLARLEADYGA